MWYNRAITREVMAIMYGQKRPGQLSFDTAVIAAPNTSARELLRAIKRAVKFDFVEKMARPYFADRGRPSIDAVLMMKMMLLGYLFGIGSDRRLVEECSDRLSFREFLGCLTDEPMPVHSSFTHWRQRLGKEFFVEVLRQVVKQCEEHGMGLSNVRCVDGTRVKAQAGRGGPLVEVPKGADVDEYLQEYFARAPEASPAPEPPPPPPLKLAGDAAPDDGGGGGDGEAGEAEAEKPETIAINTHDPDARLDARRGERAEFRYSVSFLSDPESGLITDATALPREASGTAIKQVARDPGQVRELVADTLYNDVATLAELQARGVKCYVPLPAEPSRGPLNKGYFRYDRERDLYICPRGKELTWSRYKEDRGAHFYTAKVSDCTHCPSKGWCTKAKRRSVTRLVGEDAREATVHSGPRYDRLMSWRGVSEHLNNVGKRDHCLSRARGLGLEAMCIQAALVAVVIDLKKLVKFLTPSPAGPQKPTDPTLPPSLASLCAFALSLALQRATAGLWRALRAAIAGIPIIPTVHASQLQPA